MPQIDNITFSYTLHLLSISYLSCYVVFTLILLKPIFREFFLFYTQPASVLLELMLLLLRLESKVIFTKQGRPGRRSITQIKNWPWWFGLMNFPTFMKTPVIIGMPWPCFVFGVSAIVLITYLVVTRGLKKVDWVIVSKFHSYCRVFCTTLQKSFIVFLSRFLKFFRPIPSTVRSAYLRVVSSFWSHLFETFWSVHRYIATFPKRYPIFWSSIIKKDHRIIERILNYLDWVIRESFP